MILNDKHILNNKNLLIGFVKMGKSTLLQKTLNRFINKIVYLNSNFGNLKEILKNKLFFVYDFNLIDYENLFVLIDELESNQYEYLLILNIISVSEKNISKFENIKENLILYSEGEEMVSKIELLKRIQKIW